MNKNRQVKYLEDLMHDGVR
jgi:hypothetical protein